jgi:hypothetical protein
LDGDLLKALSEVAFRELEAVEVLLTFYHLDERVVCSHEGFGLVVPKECLGVKHSDVQSSDPSVVAYLNSIGHDLGQEVAPGAVLIGSLTCHQLDQQACRREDPQEVALVHHLKSV